MKKIIFYFMTLLIMTNLDSYSQTATSDTLQYKSYNNSIGFIAGFTTGYGLSYRRYIKRFGVQITSGPTYSEGGEKATVSSGLTLFYRLNKKPDYRANYYLYFSNHYYYHKYTWHFQNSNQGPIITSVKEDKSWNTGLGVDFNLRMNNRFGMDIMVGYAQYDTFTSLTFTGEFGLYYKF
jgi:hypothetical protein